MLGVSRFYFVGDSICFANSLTFNRMRSRLVAGPVMMAIPLARPLLPRKPFVRSTLDILLVSPPSKRLVVIENGGTNGLLCTILPNDILVENAGLEVAGKELWDAEAWPTEHGSSACVLSGVIAAGKAAIRIVWSSGESRRGKEGEGATARGSERNTYVACESQ